MIVVDGGSSVNDSQTAITAQSSHPVTSNRTSPPQKQQSESSTYSPSIIISSSQSPIKPKSKRSNSITSPSSLFATGFSISHPKSTSINHSPPSPGIIADSWPSKDLSPPNKSLKRFDSFCSIEGGKIVQAAGKKVPNGAGVGAGAEEKASQKDSSNGSSVDESLRKEKEIGESGDREGGDKGGQDHANHSEPSGIETSSNPTSNAKDDATSSTSFTEDQALLQSKPQPLRPSTLKSTNSYHSPIKSSTIDESEMTTYIPTNSEHHRSKSQYFSISSSSASPFTSQSKRISFSRNVRNGDSPAPRLMLPPQFSLAMQQEQEEQRKQQEERDRLNVTSGGGRGGNGRNKLGFRFRRPKTAPATTNTSSSGTFGSVTPSPEEESKESIQFPTSNEDRSLPRRQVSEAENSGSETQEILQSTPISRSNSSNNDAFGPVAFCQSSNQASGVASTSDYGPSPLSASPLTSNVELPASDPISSKDVRTEKDSLSTESDLDKVSALLSKAEKDQVESQASSSSTEAFGSSSSSKGRTSKRPASAGAGNGCGNGKWSSASFGMSEIDGGTGRKRVSSDASSSGASLKSLPTQLGLNSKDRGLSDDGRISPTRLESLPLPPRAFYPGTLILVRDRKSSSSEGSGSEDNSEVFSACTDQEGSEVEPKGEPSNEQINQERSEPFQVSHSPTSPINHLSIPSRSIGDNAASSSTVNSPTTLLTPGPSSTSDDEDAGSTTSMDSNLLIDTPINEHQIQFAELVPTTSHPRSPGGRKILWNNEISRPTPLLNAPPSPLPKAEDSSVSDQTKVDQDDQKVSSVSKNQVNGKRESQNPALRRFEKVGKAIRAVVRILNGKGNGEEMESKRKRERRERSMNKTSEVEERLYDEHGEIKIWKQESFQNEKESENSCPQERQDIIKSQFAASSTSKRIITRSLSFSKNMRTKASKILNQDKYERTSSMRIVSSRDLGTVNSILLSPISSMHAGAHVKARSAGYNEFGALKMGQDEESPSNEGNVVVEGDRPTLTLSLPLSAPVHRTSRSGSMATGSSNSPSIYAQSPNLPRPTAFELPPPSQQTGRPRSSRNSMSRSSSRRGSAQSSKGVNLSSTANQKVQIQSPVNEREKGNKMKDRISKEEDELKKISTRESMTGSHDVDGGAEHYL